MTDLYGSTAAVDRLLRESKLWFVVGLGNNPDRAAYQVASVLQHRGKRMIPIYPRAEIVHGEQGYASVAEAAAAVGTPDVVDVFVRSDRAGEFADAARQFVPGYQDLVHQRDGRGL